MPRSCSLCVFRVSFRGCGPAPSPPGRFACAGEGVVKYPRRVACPSGRRCSTRNAVWCHSHPGFKSQRYRHCRPLLRCGLVRRLDARPGPVSQSMLYPQCRIQFPNACSLQLCEKPGISTITIQIMKCVRGNCMRICVDEVPPSVVGVAAGPCRDSRPCCLTPPSPLRPPAEPQLKPLSPLRVRHGCLWCVFRLQWCCWFQWLLFRGAQW